MQIISLRENLSAARITPLHQILSRSITRESTSLFSLLNIGLLTIPIAEYG